MGKKGNSIPCPLGGSQQKRRKPPAAEGSGIIVAAVQNSEGRYVKERIQALELALEQAGNETVPEVQDEVNARPNNGPDIMEMDHENNTIMTFQQPADDQAVELPPDDNTTFSNYVRGSYYKSKRLAEKANWAKNLPDMFTSYMTLSKKTLNWGDTSMWDHNFNHGCCCGVGKLRTRKVDMLDILTRKQDKIQFCDCSSDQVRLMRMGYIGGSPVHPQTAYSIRLLRLQHALWKYCTVRTQGFALALDSFLDPACPLILVKNSKQPRRWRKTLSLAIDAFRYMLKKEKQLTTCALSLSAMDVLAMNCPRCFGPLQQNDIPDECDYHVCTDGNFQHRRHLAASREYEEHEIETPPLFLDPKKIDEWEKRVSNQGRDNELVVFLQAEF
ncbi:hypothetical protein DFH28DRAFT_1079760 [Melampsora americana]|nr:hypothetical protein DFH28DRAFT_1079760 [Melampsora americana]